MCSCTCALYCFDVWIDWIDVHSMYAACLHPYWTYLYSYSVRTYAAIGDVHLYTVRSKLHLLVKCFEANELEWLRHRDSCYDAVYDSMHCCCKAWSTFHNERSKKQWLTVQTFIHVSFWFKAKLCPDYKSIAPLLSWVLWRLKQFRDILLAVVVVIGLASFTGL